jgi:hemerythrin
LLVWRDEYSVGVEMLDNQHKKLFEIGNNIILALREDSTVDRNDKITSLLKDLKDYTIYHFKSEETFMKEINYDKYLPHKSEHDAFIKRLEEVKLRAFDNEQDVYLQELLKFIIGWISNHILKSDLKYMK